MNERIALLGPKGTFSEEAALSFDSTIERIYCDTIEDVFEEVILGTAKYAMVPVENSLEGSVPATLEMFLKKDVTICREIVLDISHCLMGLPGTRVEEVKEVISHPHALAQCRGFLKSLKGVKTRNFPSTAEAAREVAFKGLKDTAAIAPRISAKIYGLHIISEGIQDQETNQTRFFVISRECPKGLVNRKTSIVFGLTDRPGALYEVLGHFAKSGVNLTKIESRPTRKSLGDYLFYIDFAGNVDDEKIKKTLARVGGLTTSLKVLGSYSTD
jgi:prephenate dehydratase